MARQPAVAALDHVNIRTDDIPGTARFFEEVLGLTPGPAPGLPADRYLWMYDAEGRAPIHVNARREGDGSGASGAVHHVAFACVGYRRLIETLDRLGVARRESQNPETGVRQVFFEEPNGARIECGFSPLDESEEGEEDGEDV